MVFPAIFGSSRSVYPPAPEHSNHKMPVGLALKQYGLSNPIGISQFIKSGIPKI